MVLPLHHAATLPAAEERVVVRHARRLAVLASACLLLAVSPVSALAEKPAPSLSVPCATLTTADGTHLWSRSADTPRRVASTIKMLNALVVMEHADLNETVVVSRKAADVPEGGVGLVAGQRVTVRQLLEMMLIASANDAAEALAIHISGSEAKYVALMNAKAKELGLTHTRAADPHGLGKREVSSAADLSVIAREVLTYPALKAIVSRESVLVPRTSGRRERYASTDKLLGSYQGLQGVKTGFTNPAGFCFVGSAKRGDTELVGVVLGAASDAERFSQMRTLLDWGFANFRTSRLVSTDSTMGVVGVGDGSGRSVTVHASDEYAVVESGDAKATAQVTLPASVPTSVWRGQQLGTVSVMRDGVAVAIIPLLADAAVSAETTPADLPAPAPATTAAPTGNVWERMHRSATHAMGLLVVRLSGTAQSSR